MLYDAYYEDLEQYALYQQQYLSSLSATTPPDKRLPPPPGPGPFPGSVEVDRYGAVVASTACMNAMLAPAVTMMRLPRETSMPFSADSFRAMRCTSPGSPTPS